MALRKVDKTIPKNAVVLNETEALHYQWKQIFDWPNKWDVWALRYGLISVSGATAITAGYILRFHRRKIKLREYGYLTSAMALMVAPAVAASVIHLEYITNNLIIFKTPCAVCLQTKAAALQLIAGVAYPLIFSPITCSVLALHGGIRIPNQQGWWNTAKSWYKLSKPMYLPLTLMAGMQVFCSIGLTYFEGKQFYKIHQKVLKSKKVLVSKTVT